MTDRIDTTAERKKLAAVKGAVFYLCGTCGDETNCHPAEDMLMLPEGGLICEMCEDQDNDGDTPPAAPDLEAAYAAALDEIDRLRNALIRIREASKFWAEYADGNDAIRYAHESTRRLASAALQSRDDAASGPAEGDTNS